MKAQKTETGQCENIRCIGGYLAVLHRDSNLEIQQDRRKDRRYDDCNVVPFLWSGHCCGSCLDRGMCRLAMQIQPYTDRPADHGHQQAKKPNRYRAGNRDCWVDTNHSQSLRRTKFADAPAGKADWQRSGKHHNCQRRGDGNIEFGNLQPLEDARISAQHCRMRSERKQDAGPETQQKPWCVSQPKLDFLLANQENENNAGNQCNAPRERQQIGSSRMQVDAYIEKQEESACHAEEK